MALATASMECVIYSRSTIMANGTPTVSKLTSMRGSGRANTVAWQRVGGAYVKVTMVTVALLRVNDSEAQHGLLWRGRPRDPPYHLGFKETYFAHPPRPGRPLDGSVMRSMRTRASGSFRKGPASDGDTRNRVISVLLFVLICAGRP